MVTQLTGKTLDPGHLPRGAGNVSRETSASKAADIAGQVGQIPEIRGSQHRAAPSHTRMLVERRGRAFSTRHASPSIREPARRCSCRQAKFRLYRRRCPTRQLPKGKSRERVAPPIFAPLTCCANTKPGLGAAGRTPPRPRLPSFTWNARATAKGMAGIAYLEPLRDVIAKYYSPNGARFCASKRSLLDHPIPGIL